MPAPKNQAFLWCLCWSWQTLVLNLSEWGTYLGTWLCPVTCISNITSIIMDLCKGTDPSRTWEPDPFWQNPWMTWLSGPGISIWGNSFARKMPRASPQFPFIYNNVPLFLWLPPNWGCLKICPICNTNCLSSTPSLWIIWFCVYTDACWVFENLILYLRQYHLSNCFRFIK